VRRILGSLAFGILALVLTYPVACSGGEFQVLDRCRNVLGLSLPGFTYRAPNDEWKVFVLPVAAMLLAAAAGWWVAGRATSRS
jgi:hypothetical protein